MMPPLTQFFTNTGVFAPLSGGKIYFAEPGTTAGPGSVTLKDTYTDITAQTANLNPVILDAQGRANIWLLGYYSVAVYDSLGILIKTEDNVSASGADIGGSIPVFFDTTVSTITQDLSGLTEYQAFKTDSSANTVILIDTSGATFQGGNSSYTLSLAGQYVHLVLHGKVWYPEAEIVSGVPKVITGAIVTGGILGGGISKKSDHVLTVAPTSCLDKTLSQQLYFNDATDVTIPSVASTGFFLFNCRKKIDGTCDVRAYTTEALADADADVSYLRMIGWWPTKADTKLVDGIYANFTLWYTTFADNTINTSSAVPANITTAIALTSYTPANRISEILIGAKGAAPGQNIALSGVSGTSWTTIQATYGNNAAGDIFEWDTVYTPRFVPIVDGNLYWGRGTLAATCNSQLAIHAMKLNV